MAEVLFAVAASLPPWHGRRGHPGAGRAAPLAVRRRPAAPRAAARSWTRARQNRRFVMLPQVKIDMW